MKKQVVFFYNKSDDKFSYYRCYTNEDIDVLNKKINEFNNGKYSFTAKIVKDEDVRLAILQKEQSDTIISRCDDVMDSVESCNSAISDLRYSISELKEKVNTELQDLLNENKKLSIT